MAEGTYVKLTKEQTSSENITPGELHQPIDVNQLNAPKCDYCGQILPESYHPPAVEDWTTGLFGCIEDVNSCWTGLCCPCMLFGRNLEKLNDEISYNCACVGHAICVEGGIALAILTATCHGTIDPGTVALLAEGLFCTWWLCSVYTGIPRQILQRKYRLKDSPCEPSTVHLCFHWCALCQEHREMKNHLSEESVSGATIMNSPPIQEMNISPGRESESSSKEDVDHPRSNMELQPI